jgi:nicotinamidase-related amidase
MSSRYTSPDFAAAGLITIDTQRDVLDGGLLEIAGTSTALEPMRDLVLAFRAAARPIVHIVRIYRSDGSNVDLCRRELVEHGARPLAPGALGTQLARDLLPDPEVTLDDELLLAGGVQRLGAEEAVIYQTSLESHLTELKVNTLVFCGCNYPNCPRTSIYEASERDFRIVLALDAVSGLYERAEAELADIGVQLMSTRQVLAYLGAAPAPRTAGAPLA